MSIRRARSEPSFSNKQPRRPVGGKRLAIAVGWTCRYFVLAFHPLASIFLRIVRLDWRAVREYDLSSGDRPHH
jgi:hypothetical protein